MSHRFSAASGAEKPPGAFHDIGNLDSGKSPERRNSSIPGLTVFTADQGGSAVRDSQDVPDGLNREALGNMSISLEVQQMTDAESVILQWSDWVAARCRSCLGVSEAQFSDGMADAQSVAVFGSFFTDVKLRLMFAVHENSGHFSFMLHPPFTSSSVAPTFSALYFVKLSQPSYSQFTEVDPDDVLVGTISSNVLDHMFTLSSEVIFPVLMNALSSDAVSETLSRDLTTSFHQFLSQSYITLGLSRGRTLLPLPPKDSISAAFVNDKAASKDKERIHLLESCVITWTRQIRLVLKLEGLTESGEPALQISQGISTEFDIWRSRADNLSSLYEQLQSERLRKVLRILEATKSTYYVPFTRLCKEVAVAREEAMELNRYYRPIRKLTLAFMKTASIWNLHFLFRPISHMFLLAWRESRHFAQSSRISICFEKLGNNIIQLATSEITGKGILSDTSPRAESLLRQAVMVSSILRTVFIDYRQKSELDRSGANPWKVQESSVFAKLDLFLERCHDILDLLETNEQFTPLKLAVIGGARGKKLTRMVAQIHQEFVVAFERMRGLPYNIFDISIRDFDDDYFEFRTCVRALERRVAVLVIEGMDADSSLQGSFKILQSLSSMLCRKLIQQSLNSRFLKLLDQGRAEIKKARELFVAHKLSPPLSIGMPQHSGSISWARSLLHRAQASLSGFQQLLPFMLAFDEGKDLCETFSQLESSVLQFEADHIERVSKSVGKDILDSLKHPLLLRDKVTSLLSVNIDAQLLVFVREARCFRRLGLTVPEPVLAVESKAESLRQYVSNLELIVGQYNNIKQLLNPVEAQLLQSKLLHVDASLEEAIRSMTWKSHSIAAFLKRIMVLIKESSQTVHLIKTSCQSIEESINSWSLVPLFDVQFRRTVTAPVFLEDFKGVFAGRCYELKEQANSIVSKINQVHALLGISRGEVSWRNFISNLSQRILNCLKAVTSGSLQALQEMVDPAHISNKNLPPLLEIRVELVAPDVLFSPDLRSNIKGESITSVLKVMLDAVTIVPSLLKKLDVAGDFGDDVLSDSVLQEKIKTFWNLASDVFAQSNSLFTQYDEFRHLWELESSVVFNEFLENVTKRELPFSEELHLFQEALSKIKISENRVRDLPNFAQFSWLRVDCKPMKQALYTLISKWSFSYTEYLSNKLHLELQELMVFVRTTSSSLARVIDGDHSASLDQIVSHISNVHENKDSSVATLKRMSMIHTLLNTFGFECPSWIPRALTALPDEILTLNELATRCRSQLEDIIELQRSRILERAEKFQSLLKDFTFTFKATLPLTLDTEPELAYKMLGSLISSESSSGSLSLSTLLSQSNSIRNLQLLYDIPQSSFPEIDACWLDCRSLKHVWDFVSIVDQTLQLHGATNWMTVDLAGIQSEFQFLAETAQSLPESTRQFDIAKAIMKRVDDVIETISLLILVRSSQIKERFWKMIIRAVTQSSEQEKSTSTLIGMISLRLCDHSDFVRDILFKASREAEVEAILKNLQDVWEEQVFSIKISIELSVEETGSSLAQDETASDFVFEDLPMLMRPHSVIDLLSDSMLRLQGLSRDSFVSGNQTFAEDVQRWQRRLSMVEAAIDLWFLVQNRIRTLSNLFASSPKLAAVFPENFNEVKVLRQRWWRVMRIASEKPSAIDVCNEEGHLATLRAMSISLEMEEAALQKHVTSMCEEAPRLLLLPSNQAIILLGAGSDGTLINTAISGLFQGISCIIWEGSANELSVAPPEMRSPSKQTIKSNARVSHLTTKTASSSLSNSSLAMKDSIIAVAVRGRLGEVIKFESQQYVNCSGSANGWLPTLVNSVREVLISQVVLGVQKSSSSMPGSMWFEDICGQVAALCCSIEHTNSVFEALTRSSSVSTSDNLEAVMSSINFEISARAIALQQDTWVPASGIPGVFPSSRQAGLRDDERRKIAQSIICSVSYRDLVSSLIGDGISSCEDFAVLAMPRVIYNDAERASNPVVVRLGFSEFKYQFEYAGEEYRPTLLCPTTVRSMAAVFSASQANTISVLVGSACGRSSLANEIALFRGSMCLSYSLNWVGSELSLTRIVAAATATGTTLCLDINGTMGSTSTILLPSILSVLSSTCLCVFASIRAGAKSIVVNEFSIPLENLSVSIVLKSSTSSLSDSLLPPAFLSLLRPIHVQLPSLVLCAEALLFCEGFYYARNLASRLKSLFTLCASTVFSVHRGIPFQFNVYVLRSIITASAFLMYSRDFLEIRRSAQDLSAGAQIEHLDPEDPNIDSPSSPSVEKSEFSRAELRELRLLQQGVLDALFPRLDSEEILRLAVVMETVFSPLSFPKCTASKSRPPTSQLARSRPVSAQGSIPYFAHHFKSSGKRDVFSRGEIRTPLSPGRRQKSHTDKTPLLRDSEWSTFENAFNEASRFCSLQVTDELLSCAARLHATLAMRTSAAIIGPVGCGKTGLWKTMSCMRSNDLPVISAFPFYQHALPVSVLYGFNKEFNGNSIWSPGMLEFMFNQLVSSNSDARKERWLIFDGPMDCMFADVISPILQYGCTYKNPNLGSLPLFGGLRIIFETTSVAFASPALVSSIGIVNFSLDAIDWLLFVNVWLDRVSTNGVDVGGNMKILIPTSLAYLAENALCDPNGILSCALDTGAQICGISSNSLPEHLVSWKCNRSRQVCYFLEAFLSYHKDTFPSSDFGLSNGPISASKSLIESIHFSVLWAIGSDMTDLQRQKFSTWAVEAFDLHNQNLPQNIFECFFNGDSWLDWNDHVPQTIFTHQHARQDSSTDVVGNMLVPTSEGTCVLHLLEILSLCRQPVVLKGSAAVGKSAILREKISQTDNETTISSIVFLHSHSQCSNLQDSIECCFERKFGRVFGPLSNKKLLLVIEDLHLPMPDVHGHRNSHELLRQMMDSGFIYDRQHFAQRILQGYSVIAASRPQDDCSSRLMRHFVELQIYGPSRDVLISIFNNVLSSAFSKMSDGVRRLIPAIVRSTIDVIWDMQENVSLDVGGLSIFNMHMVARVIEAMFSLEASTHDSQNTVLHMWLNELYSSVGDFLTLKDDGLLLKESVSSRLKSNFNSSDVLESGQPIIFVQVIPFRSSVSTRNSVFSVVSEAAFQKPSIVASRAKVGFLRAANMASKAVRGKEMSEYEQVSSFSLQDCEKISTQTLDSKPIPYIEISLPDLLKYSYQLISAFPTLKGIKVICHDVAVHAARISFNFSKSFGGHSVLVGNRGCGKRTAALFASVYGRFTFFEAPLSSSNQSDRRIVDFVKSCTAGCGVYSKRILAFLSFENMSPSDLLLVSTLLSGFGFSQAMSLFNRTERNIIYQAMRPQMRKSGLVDTPESCWSLFCRRVSSNLRVCFSIITSTFDQSILHIPCLHSNALVLRFNSWTPAALTDICYRRLSPICSESVVLESLAAHIVTLHSHGILANPNLPDSRVLFMLDCLEELFLHCSDHIQIQSSQLSTALITLSRIPVQLLEFSTITSHMQISFNQRAANATSCLSQVGSETTIMEDLKSILSKDEEYLAQCIQQLSDLQAEWDSVCRAAQPYQSALESALSTLDKDALAELRSMPTPPESVCLVVGAVSSIVNKINKVSSMRMTWVDAKKVLLYPDKLLVILQKTGVNSINSACINAIEEFFIQNPNFVPDKIVAASVTAAKLCQWVISFITYYRTISSGIPVQAALQKAANVVEVASQRKVDSQLRLQVSIERIASLTRAFETATEEKTASAVAVQNAEERVNIAHRLLAAFETMHPRWKHNSDMLELRKKCLIGDCCIASLVFSYFGLLPSVQVHDAAMISYQELSTRGVPLSIATPNSIALIGPDHNISESLSHPQILIRNLSSLVCCGTDEALFQRALPDGTDVDILKFMTVFSLRHFKSCWPLIVDPMNTIVGVISAMSSLSSIIHVHNSDLSAVNVVLAAVALGKTVIYVLDEEPVPSLLLPVMFGRFELSEISSEQQSTGSKSKAVSNFSYKSVSIDGKGVIDLHAYFRLIFVCDSERTLKFHPDLFSHTIPIVFQRDKSSLCAELINHVIAKVSPSSESQQADITQAILKLNAEASSNEISVLRHLGDSTDILGRSDVVQLIESAQLFDVDAFSKIQELRGRCKLLTEKMWFQEPLQELFITLSDICRKLHKAGCVFDTSVGFLLSIMQSLSASFLKPLADSIISCAEVSSSLDENRAACELSVKNALRSVAVHVLRVLLSSISVPEKIVALLWFCQKSEECTDRELLQSLIDNLATLSSTSTETDVSCPVPWLTPLQWARFYRVCSFPSARLAHAVSDIRSLRDWVACRLPEQEPLPGLLAECTPVERFILLFYLRPDRIIQSSTAFFEAVAHPDFGILLTESSHAALEQIFRNPGLASCPIVFIGELSSRALDSMMARCGIASIEHILLDANSNAQIIEAATHGGCVSVNVSSVSGATVLQSCLAPVLLTMIHAARLSNNRPPLISSFENISSSFDSTSKHLHRCMKDWSDFFAKRIPHPQFRIIIIAPSAATVPHTLRSECITIVCPPAESIAPLGHSLNCRMNFAGSLSNQLEANLLHVLSDSPTIATEGQNSTWPVSVMCVAVLHAVLSLTLPAIGKDMLFQMVSLSRNLPLQPSFTAPPRNSSQLVDAILSLAITHVPLTAVMFSRLRLLCECICSVNYSSFMPVSPHFVSFPRAMTNSDSIKRYDLAQYRHMNTHAHFPPFSQLRLRHVHGSFA